MLDSYQGMASAMPPQLSFRFRPRRGGDPTPIIQGPARKVVDPTSTKVV